MDKLKGKIALVTGVGRKNGIGAAVCRELAKNGADIFFTYWHKYDAENYSETKNENPADFSGELKQFGVRVACVEIDLSKSESPAALFKMVVNELGIPDILINNAAVSTRVPFKGVTSEMLDQHFAVNVRAAVLLCQEFIKAWNKDTKGEIINMTSGQSLGVMRDELPYTITKASVEMITKQLAPEFALQGITINALDSGPTDTGWIGDELKEQILKDSKKGKINMPEDTAKLIFNLLSSNETGQIIHAEW